MSVAPTHADDSASVDSASVDSVHADDSVLAPPSKTKVFVVTSLERKYKDFSVALSLLGVDVVMVNPGKVDELASHDPHKLLIDKMQRLKGVVGKLSGFVIYEDTSFTFVKNGVDLQWPGFNISSLSSKHLRKTLYEWATFLGAQEGKYTCSCILETPDGRNFYFTATCDVTMCDRRPGEGAIDPFTIPKGSVKAFSEMDEEERANPELWPHTRNVIARQVARKIQEELGY
jgi:inosine/xanthosine triphosphate pyrophosphatase family protein